MMHSVTGTVYKILTQLSTSLAFWDLEVMPQPQFLKRGGGAVSEHQAHAEGSNRSLIKHIKIFLYGSQLSSKL